MSVSGFIYEPTDDDYDDGYGLSRVACDDRVVVSNGFNFVADHVVIDGEIIAEHYRLVHHLGILNENGEIVGYGYAHLDEITCDYSEDSVELSRNRLELHFPDLIDEIDVRMYNAPSTEEAILALSDLAVLGDPDDNDYRLAVIDMQQYIDQLADLDTVLPYFLESTGPFVMEFSSGELGYSPQDSMVAGYVISHGVRFLRTEDQPQDDRELLVAHLWCTFHGATREDERVLWVPIANISEFYSLRKHYVAEELERAEQ